MFVAGAATLAVITSWQHGLTFWTTTQGLLTAIVIVGISAAVPFASDMKTFDRDSARKLENYRKANVDWRPVFQRLMYYVALGAIMYIKR